MRKYYKTRNVELYLRLANQLKRKKYKKSPIERIKTNIRKHVKTILKTHRERVADKRSYVSTALGCTGPELVKYFESKFTPEMTWKNYGTYWHVDHIRPLASFNLVNIDERKKANHYTNLQPLKAEDNLKKGAKYDLVQNL